MSRIDFSKVGDPIVIVSHPRSGTHLTIDLIRKQFSQCKSYKFPLEPQHYLYLSIEGFLENRSRKRLSESQGFRIISRPQRPVIKFHTYSYSALKDRYPQWMDWMETKGKFIFVMRDVREVLSSYYVYAQSFERNANVPMGEFIRQSYCGRKNRVAYWDEMIRHWSSKPNVLMLDYGKIVRDTRGAVQTIGEFIGEAPLYKEPLLPKKLDSIWQFRWDRLMSICPESTAILGSKSGAKVSWKKELVSTDLDFIKENAGEAMQKYNFL